MTIRGESVTLYAPAVTYDENKDEITTWTETELGNVLFASPSTKQIDEAMRLYGVRAQYTLHFPKTFTGSLRGCYVVRTRDVAQEPDAATDGATDEATDGTETADDTETADAVDDGANGSTDDDQGDGEESGETAESGEADEPNPPKYWIAGDPQPYPPENCPPHVPWNREAIAGWVDG